LRKTNRHNKLIRFKKGQCAVDVLTGHFGPKTVRT